MQLMTLKFPSLEDEETGVGNMRGADNARSG